MKIYGKYHKYCDYYIHKKYKDLKTEMLQNKTYPMTQRNYKTIKLKAEKKLKTDYCKAIRSDATNDVLHYEIKQNIKLKLENLFVLIMYCDFDGLSATFSATFRKTSKHECLQSLKQRNAEFWWFSKLLRETVECFGTEVEESSIAKFYHGTSMMVFSGTFFITNFSTC